MLVRQLMQRDVITLPIGSTLDLAEGLMGVDRVRHIPVVSGKSVAGLVSERDLLRAAVSSFLDVEPAERARWLGKIPVEDVMTRDVICAHPEAPVETAVEMMLNERIGCLPVVEDGALVGLLSETDCLRHLSRVLRNDEERRSLT